MVCMRCVVEMCSLYDGMVDKCGLYKVHGGDVRGV